VADQEVPEHGDVLLGDIGWELWWVRGSRRGWVAKWGWKGWVGDSQGMKCLASVLKEREGLAEDVEIFEAE
jgi:hypothetical protein